MYLYGFGNYHQSECIPGALPTEQNAPQHCTHHLYAEQLSGSAFCRPRHLNLHSWLYRRLPSVVRTDFTPLGQTGLSPLIQPQSPNPMRWSPMAETTEPFDFIHGLSHVATSHGNHCYRYQCYSAMHNQYFVNYDGEWLFIPYQGTLTLHTEFGILSIPVGHIAVIPRGIVFKVLVTDGYTAGYLCENTGAPFTLPQLGIIGANGLANPRHFYYPTASMESIDTSVTLICQYQQHWWQSTCPQSPLNVAAWQGNYAPYGYDLSLFNTINTVSFDHPDPSIFTVLTSESPIPTLPQLDFVIFPPRWMVAEHTFRPPYFHRNVMSELMGLLIGEYDAKPNGFEVGGISIHNQMTPHGPDAQACQKAIAQTLKPEHYDNTLAFMLESQDPWLVTEAAYHHHTRQHDYSECWQTLLKPEVSIHHNA